MQKIWNLLVRFWNWLVSWIALIIAIILVPLAIWHIDAIRSALSGLNAPLIDEISTSMTFRIFVAPWVQIALTVVEGIIAVLLLAFLLRRVPRLVGAVSLLTVEALRSATMVVSVVASFAFGAYVFSILWGDVSVFGFVLLKAYDPDKLTFSLGMDLGIAAAWYAVSQAAPFMFRPSVGVAWGLFDTLSSLVPLAFVFGAIADYWFGSYPWTTYKLAAMKVWGPIELIDLANMSMNMWLVKRGFFGFEETAAGGAHSHGR